jgi:hypothetical protein
MLSKVRLSLAAVSILALTGTSSFLGSGSAYSAPAFVDQSPYPVVSAGFYQPLQSVDGEYVVYRCGARQELCEVHNKRHGYTKQVIGMGPLNSAPSLSLDWQKATSSGVPYQYVFWQGPAPKYDLMEAYFNGKWHGPLNLGMGKLGSAPAAPQVWYESSASGNPNGEVVAWTNSQDQLYYARSDNPSVKSSWKGPYTDRHIGNIGYSLSVIDGGGGFDTAWWAGPGDHLYAADFPTDPNGAKWGPCDFGMGKLGTTPSVDWGPDLFPPSGPSVDSPGNAEPGPAAKPKFGNPGWKGSCPRDVYATAKDWYGRAGEYTVCWGGDTSKGGLYCMAWGLISGTKGEIAGPVKLGKMGVLGSAPSITRWPYVVDSNLSPMFWMSSATNEDLITAQFYPPGKPKNLGFGPIGPGV